ncbi:MAG: hypothetical protein ACU826_00865 [Gammaproteobacteria bacterium]
MICRTKIKWFASLLPALFYMSCAWGEMTVTGQKIEWRFETDVLLGCDNKGPNIMVGLGGVVLAEGLNGKIKFQFQNNVTGSHEKDEFDVEATITLFPADETVYIPKQPPLGGAGGTPLVYFSFDGDENQPCGEDAISFDFKRPA